MAVNEILLWRLLGEEDPDDELLLAQLERLAAEVLPTRWPFLGPAHLGRFLIHQSPAFRRVAVRCYAGASGTGSWPLLLTACQDEDNSVRQAAREALQVSCRADPPRWVHLLLDSDGQVVRWALRHLPRGFPRKLLLPLLADAENRAAVLEAIGPLSLPEHAGGLLWALEEGFLPGAIAVEALAAMPWERETDTILQVVRRTRAWPATQFAAAMAAAPDGAEALLRLLQSPPLVQPECDRLFDACWDQLLSGQSEGMLRRIGQWCLATPLDSDDRHQLAASLTRVATRRSHWTAELLALCASVLPALLEDERIPASCREAAVIGMRLVRGEDGPAWWEEGAKRVLAGGFYRAPDGHLDLRLVSGFPVSPGGWGALGAASGWDDAVNESLRTDSEGAVLLLARAGDWPPESRESIVRRVEACWSPGIAEAMADHALTHPISAIEMIGWLEPAYRDEALWALLLRLEAAPQAIAPRECALLAEEIMRQQTGATVSALCGTLLRLKDPKNHILGRRLLHAVAANPSFAQALEQKPWDLAAQPSRKRSAPTHIGDLFRTTVVEECLDLGRPDDQPEIVDLCPEEIIRFHRARPSTIDREVDRYAGRATRGLIPALACHSKALCKEWAVTYWSLFLRAGDADDVLCQSLERTLLFPPCLVADELKERLGRHQSWPFVGGLLARALGLEVTSGALHDRLSTSWTVSDLLLFGFRQPSDLVTKAVLDAVRTRAPSADTVETALDPDARALLWSLLRWATGMPWDGPGGPPHPGLEAALVGPAENDNRLEADILALLPRDDWPDHSVSFRVSFRAGEKLREAQRGRGVEASLSPAFSLPSLQLDLGIGGGSLDHEEAAAQSLWSEDIAIAMAGAEHLQAMGGAWEELVTNALVSDPPAPRSRELARLVRHMPGGPWLAHLKRLVGNKSAPPELRAHCGLGLWLATGQEPAGLAEALEKYRDPPEFELAEWDRVLALPGVGDHLVDAAVRNREARIHEPIVGLLLQQSTRSPRIMTPLRTFLELGDGRSHRLRVEAARYLLGAGCPDGLPVILGAEFDCFSDTPTHHAAFDALTGPELESVVEAALLSGQSVTSRFVVDSTRRGMDRFPRWLPLVLARSRHDEPTRTRALMRIACDSGESQNRKEALANLRASGKSHPITERLTRTLWWGEDTAIGLTGQRFAIELLTDDDLGYTSLAERRIFVSPLPLLREELNSDEILRGLILHEVGHHMYHATTDALAVNRVAWDEGLGNLLNLVQDEHLERNLRAREPYYGICLSRLAAYAFHHSRREIPIPDLMHPRSGLSLEQLRRLPLTAAREDGHFRVDLGEVLQQLEAGGSSLVRFVRALRMGLGNRREDPKVAEALALFGRRFRRSTPAEHLAIARRLRDLFGTDIAVISLFRLDESLAATQEELRSAGVDPEAVARERARPRPKRGLGRKSINRGAEETFPELTEVVQLSRAGGEHQALAIQVRVPALRLRRHLQAMGLGLQPQRRRVAGPRLDRSRLGMSITTGDARILVRRQPKPTADLFLGLLVDCSGSMGSEGKIERARLIATMVAEACRHLPGVDLRIMGFTDRLLYDAGDAAACAAHALTPGEGNNDAGALWHVAQLALKSRRSARLLLMVSDGSPTECTVTSLRALVERLTLRHGLACAQVAVEPLSEVCFEHYVEVCEPEAVPAAARFGEVLAALTQKSMRRG